MQDRTMMDSILTATKGACDLMMHGAIESSTKNVHSAFTQTFNDTLAMQNEIYTLMAQKGWYPSQQAEAQKIEQARQKFAAKA